MSEDSDRWGGVPVYQASVMSEDSDRCASG